MGRFRGVPDRNRKDAHRINEHIRAREIRVVDQHGNQLGVMPTPRALELAKQAKLDLAEISPKAVPPVCKILDYGKFKFQEQKRQSEARKKQQNVTVKELPIRPRTDEHDYQIKLKKARQFLEEGNKMKFNLRFRGRETSYAHFGQEMLDRLIEDTKDIARIENRTGLEGRFMTLILAPLNPPKAKGEKKEAEKLSVEAAEKAD